MTEAILQTRIRAAFANVRATGHTDPVTGEQDAADELGTAIFNFAGAAAPLTVGDGSASDFDIIEVDNGAAPAPEQIWDENEDAFSFNKGLRITAGNVDIGAGNFKLTGNPSGTPAANTLYEDNVVKAWINFAGTGTIAINDSFNVSGITDNGTGDYTIDWARDFDNNDYAAVGTVFMNASTPRYVWIRVQSASQLRIRIATGTDADGVCFIAMGEQA